MGQAHDNPASISDWRVGEQGPHHHRHAFGIKPLLQDHGYVLGHL